MSHSYEWETWPILMNESCLWMSFTCATNYSYEWVISHVWMFHVTHVTNESSNVYSINESYTWVIGRVLYEWVIRMSHRICVLWLSFINESSAMNDMNESYEWVIRYVLYEWVMSLVWMCLVARRTCEWVMAHVSCRTCAEVMSNVWMCHATRVHGSCHTYNSIRWHINESCHTFERVIPLNNESCHRYERVTHMNGSCHTYEWVMSHIWMRDVTHINGSCHKYECVTHLNGLCRTFEWVTSLCATYVHRKSSQYLPWSFSQLSI